MSKQIECTLTQAIIHCQTEGGRARLACDHNDWYDASDFADRETSFSVDYITSIWIWEPPKETAFRKWITNNHYRVKNMDNPREEHCVQAWNAALDAALMLTPFPVYLGSSGGASQMVLRDQVKELKEP